MYAQSIYLDITCKNHLIICNNYTSLILFSSLICIQLTNLPKL